MTLAPLIAGDWRAVPGPERDWLAATFWLAWSGQKEPDQPGTLDWMGRLEIDGARALRLACYPRHLLVELTARDAGGPLAAAALYGPSGLRVITGRSAVLHLLNEEGWLTLETEPQARDYLRLFVSAVHADRGRFELIEAAGGLPEAARALIAAAGQKADGRLVMTREGERWAADGLMRYGDVLARAQFAISAGGLVEMVDDMPLGVIPELAVERFETPFRGLSAAAGGAP